MISRISDYRIVKKHASWETIISSKIIYLYEEGVGLWGFVPFEDSDTCYEVHVDMDENYRGKKAVEKCKSVVQWMFNNTGANRIIGQIPSHNRRACFNAVICGLDFIGKDTKDSLIRLYEVRK